jgi:hypothetical protein
MTLQKKQTSFLGGRERERVWKPPTGLNAVLVVSMRLGARADFVSQGRNRFLLFHNKSLATSSKS